MDIILTKVQFFSARSIAYYEHEVHGVFPSEVVGFKALAKPPKKSQKPKEVIGIFNMYKKYNFDYYSQQNHFRHFAY